MTCSNTKKSAVLVMALLVLAIGATGTFMMFEVVRNDDFNDDCYMKALAVIMTAVTLWIPTQSMLKKVLRDTKATMKATTESLIEKTGKMFAYQQGNVGQES